MSFSRKRIDLTISLGTGNFGEAGQNTLTLTGLRVMCDIDEMGNESCAQAAVKIYGMTPDHMNALSALTNVAMMQRKNMIQISAGDDSGMATIFQGQIMQGLIDMSAPPDAAVNLLAWTGGFEKYAAAAPRSYPGAASVAQIMADLAAAMGYAFENNGVTAVLNTPAFPGTLWEQVRRCADAAGINWTISNGTLAIWPRGGSRVTQGVPLISKDTGMIGYPGYATAWMGASVTTLFNPAIRIGGVVNVQSSLVTVANGYWTVRTVAHNLESELPGGAWITRFEAMRADDTNQSVRDM